MDDPQGQPVCAAGEFGDADGSCRLDGGQLPEAPLASLAGALDAPMLAVAIVTESMAWTIVFQVVMNLGFQAFLYYVSRIPAIASTSKGPYTVWPPVGIRLLAAEIAVVPLALGVAFLLRERKRDVL